MAAYAVTVTSALRRPVKLGENTVLWRGTANITNYNTTLAAITDITGKFLDAIPNVVVGALSTNGYLCTWLSASKSIKCYYPLGTHKHSFAVQSAGAIGTNMEIGLSVDTDAATVEGGVGITAPRTLATNSPVVALVSAAGVEVANDVDIGSVDFFAIGLS